MEIDLRTVKKIHFVGIKGVAMTALAILAKERGFAVSGSDVADLFPTDETILKAGIVVRTGFSPENIEKEQPDLVIYTGAHNGKENAEVQFALQKGIQVLPHGKALGLFMAGKRQISVAGSHGKTTTAAMITTILAAAGKDPSYAIGCGEIFGLGPPGHAGNGEFFVAEADEYATDPTSDLMPRFLWQHPEIMVVTNIDFDHPDVYGTLADVQNAFLKFQSNLVGKKITVVNADDLPSSILAQSTNPIISFGRVPKGNVEISSIHFETGETRFTLIKKRLKRIDCVLHVPGSHNVTNAAAAATCCFALGIDFETIRDGLARFAGTKRRFEYMGKKLGMEFIDDYAHHPAEINATIAAARVWFPKRRLITIFQPHTYSRTKALLADFAKAFLGTDIAVITDIYASAREHDHLNLTPDALFAETKKYHDHAVWAQSKDAVKRFLLDNGKEGDVVIFMGAGDIFSWGKEIVKEL